MSCRHSQYHWGRVDFNGQAWSLREHEGACCLRLWLEADLELCLLALPLLSLLDQQLLQHPRLNSRGSPAIGCQKNFETEVMRLHHICTSRAYSASTSTQLSGQAGLTGSGPLTSSWRFSLSRLKGSGMV